MFMNEVIAFFMMWAIATFIFGLMMGSRKGDYIMGFIFSTAMMAAALLDRLLFN